MIKQVPTPPMEWLHDGAEDYNRIFSQEVYRPDNSEPWAECTTAKKEQWETEHPAPLPEE